MGMQEHPCSGYILPAMELRGLLPIEFREEFEKAILDYNMDDVGDFLANYLPDNLPRFSDVFVLDHTDTPCNNMDIDVMYVYYEEDELYVKQPTNRLVNLQQSGISAPRHKEWSVWG